MSQFARQLDLRTLAPAAVHAGVLAAFDALAAGEGLVLVSDHDPGPLLRELQEARPDRFDWNVVEAGPVRFRVTILSRPGDSARTVSDYLETDHRRLDEMLPEVKRLAADGDFARAAALFAEFSCGLNHHIDAEEHVLFPAFERLTGMSRGPTVVMRAEHVEIRDEMQAIGAALATNDSDAFSRALTRLTNVLSDHNMKEEHILYPMTDEAAGAHEADALVREMQAISLWPPAAAAGRRR